ncbi:MAG: hypothetical protein IKB60_05890, partial [Clostridia bacterium]|nr:hypothetical protein [Clostridia bacterium]
GLTEVIANVKASNPKGTNDKFTIVAAAYAGGRLLAVNVSEPLEPGVDEETFELELEDFSGADDIKVFILNDMGSIKPLSDLGVDGGLSPVGFQQGE